MTSLKNFLRAAPGINTLLQRFPNFFFPRPILAHTFYPRSPKNNVLNPFNEQAVNEADLNPLIHDQLIELSCDKTLQLSFSTQDVDKFWLQRRAEYPSLTLVALRIIMPFATSYFCELGFSTLVNIKTKARNRLDVEDDLIVCVSKIGII